MKNILPMLLLVTLPFSNRAADIEVTGYIITLSRDTVQGKIYLKKIGKSYDFLELFRSVKFADSSGKKQTYAPADLWGYSALLPGNDAMTHFESYHNLNMHASIGNKRESAFLGRLVQGEYNLYYMRHRNQTLTSYTDWPEVYYVCRSDSTRTPIWIHNEKMKMMQTELLFNREELIAQLRSVPPHIYEKLPEHINMKGVAALFTYFNEWYEEEKKKSQQSTPGSS